MRPSFAYSLTPTTGLWKKGALQCHQKLFRATQSKRWFSFIKSCHRVKYRWLYYVWRQRQGHQQFQAAWKRKFYSLQRWYWIYFHRVAQIHQTLDELQTLQDKWIYFIQNPGRLEFISEHIKQEIKAAPTIANEANLSLEELELQRKRKEFIFIQQSSIELASERALKQGIEQGLE